MYIDGANQPVTIPSQVNYNSDEAIAYELSITTLLHKIGKMTYSRSFGFNYYFLQMQIINKTLYTLINSICIEPQNLINAN